MSESEDQADLVSLLNRQPPVPYEYPNLSFRQSCFVSRVDQVAEFCRTKDIHDAKLFVVADDERVAELQEATSFFSFPCGVFGSRDPGFFETFEINLISEHLDSADYSCMGMLYEEPVSVTEWETRWVLQVIDWMDPRAAIQAAKIL